MFALPCHPHPLVPFSEYWPAGMFSVHGISCLSQAGLSSAANSVLAEQELSFLLWRVVGAGGCTATACALFLLCLRLGVWVTASA